MKAITSLRYGQADVLKVATHSSPKPTANQVLIKVKAVMTDEAELLRAARSANCLLARSQQTVGAFG